MADACDARTLNCLYVNPTKYCNLKCRHCWIAPPRPGEDTDGAAEMSMPEIIAVIEESRGIGLSSIKLTGGEPLLRKDIGELLRYCRSNDIGLSMETNGTLITDNVAKLLSECGMSQVSVSMDSHDPDVHDAFRGMKGAHARTVAGIRRLLAVGIDVQVILSLVRDNIGKIDKFIPFVKSLGVNDIKFNVISPIGRAEALEGEGEIPSVEEVIELAPEVDALAEENNMEIFLDIPMAFKSLETLKFKGCAVCGIKGIMGLLADGTVSICGIGYMDEDMVFGNVRKDPALIKKIWQEEEVLRKIQNDMPEKFKGICGECVFRARCLGSCRAEVYHNTGDLFAPHWFCQQAYDSGLFPETRLIPKEARI